MYLPSVTILVFALALVSVRAADPDKKPEPPKSPTPTATGTFKNIDVSEFEKLRTDKTKIVLDVRTATEFSAGHIPGAINIDVNAPDFEKKVATLDPKKTYLVHCAAGVRSRKACDKLSRLDFAQLYNLEGGFRAWEKAGNKPER
jgi:phage shock protein E